MNIVNSTVMIVNNKSVCYSLPDSCNQAVDICSVGSLLAYIRLAVTIINVKTHVFICCPFHCNFSTISYLVSNLSLSFPYRSIIKSTNCFTYFSGWVHCKYLHIDYNCNANESCQDYNWSSFWVQLLTTYNTNVIHHIWH